MSKLHLKQNPTLSDLQQYVDEMVAERGFKYDIAQRFMLLIEEVGEFAQATRKTAGLKVAKNAAEQNVAHEAADVLILLLALCNQLDIDLEEAFRAKEEHNKTRTWQ